MNKEELLQMAREAGFFSQYSTDAQRVMHDFHYEDYLRFANAILERAAVECEDQSSFKHGAECFEYARAIRALKGE